MFISKKKIFIFLFIILLLVNNILTEEVTGDKNGTEKNEGAVDNNTENKNEKVDNNTGNTNGAVDNNTENKTETEKNTGDTDKTEEKTGGKNETDKKTGNKNKDKTEETNENGEINQKNIVKVNVETLYGSIEIEYVKVEMPDDKFRNLIIYGVTISSMVVLVCIIHSIVQCRPKYIRKRNERRIKKLRKKSKKLEDSEEENHISMEEIKDAAVKNESNSQEDSIDFIYNASSTDCIINVDDKNDNNDNNRNNSKQKSHGKQL